MMRRYFFLFGLAFTAIGTVAIWSPITAVLVVGVILLVLAIIG
jgi:hypothetical protein